MDDKKDMDQEMMEKVQLFVTGELDEGAHEEVLEWIASGHENLRYYYGLHTAIRAAEYYRSGKKYNMERVWSRLNHRIELAGNTRKVNFRALFRVAASLLMLVTTYTVFHQIRAYKQSPSVSEVYNIIESPFGSRARVFLPDSTYVVLNAGSTLKYPVDFLAGKSREVYLSGEGFFKVTKHKYSEFVVKVGDIHITALGTAFNVKAYPEEEVIEATLVEGLLKIHQDQSQEKAIFLRPNEKISFVKKESGILSEKVTAADREPAAPVQLQRILVRKIQVERSIDPVPEVSWKDNEWVIRGETMEELAVMLGRRYNMEIELGDEKVGDFRFSGKLKDETLEQVLYAICSTAPVDYQIEGNRVVLTLKTSLQSKYQKMLK